MPDSDSKIDSDSVPGPITQDSEIHGVRAAPADADSTLRVGRLRAERSLSAGFGVLAVGAGYALIDGLLGSTAVNTAALIGTAGIAAWLSDSRVQRDLCVVERVSDAVDRVRAGHEISRIDTSGLGSLGAIGRTFNDLFEAIAEATAPTLSQLVGLEQLPERARATLNSVESSAEDQEGAVEETIGDIVRIEGLTRDARDVLEVLAGRIGEISKIVNVIDEISDETKLLSLNAAIIAAQAGESGNAFLIVANHVKTLAKRTTASTKDIEELIRSVQAESDNAVRAMGEGNHGDRTRRLALSKGGPLPTKLRSVSRLSLARARSRRAALRASRSLRSRPRRRCSTSPARSNNSGAQPTYFSSARRKPGSSVIMSTAPRTNSGPQGSTSANRPMRFSS